MPKDESSKYKNLIFVILGAGAVAVGLMLSGVFFGGPTEEERIVGTLHIWTVQEGPNAEEQHKSFRQNFAAFYPEVKIRYREFESVAEYERTLVSSLAAGEGPDIFMVRNNDLFRKANLMHPVPNSKYSTLRLNRDFPQIVEENFVREGGSIYALPLSIDTLTLIYNRDLFNEASIVFPPETWEEFQNNVLKLVKYDGLGNIERAGAAIGGTNTNIPHAKDILSLLFLQAGVDMNDRRGRFQFINRESTDVFDFYTRFAKPNSGIYTWDPSMSGAVEAFANEDVAMIFDYARNLSSIREKAPFVNMEVAQVPQLETSSRKTSLANYWGYTVSKQTPLPGVAWDFILMMTTNPQNATEYMQTTGMPPALSSLIERNLESKDMDVWARQALTADSWMEPDPERVDDAFSEAIGAALRGSVNTRSALHQLQEAINEYNR